MSDLIRRDDVDPRNLANPRKLDGVPYTDYERGYNDGVIDAYWLTRNAKAVEAEPVVHAHWERFKHPSGTHGIRCSHCKTVNGRKSKRCPECGAHMDEEVADGT